MPDLQRLMAFGSYGVPGTWNTPGEAKGIPGDENWVGKPDFSSIAIWNLLMHIYFEILFPKDVADRWV